MAKIVDMIGRKFGRLTVLSRDEDKNNRHFKWLCQCECGNTKIIYGHSLRDKKNPTESCGCINKEKNYRGVGNLSGHYWSGIMRRAKNKGIIFELSIEDGWNLLVKQDFKCALSGKDIRLVRNVKHDYIYQTASLDRRDSTKGYTIDNVQWVHKDVNLMKNILDEEYFVELCSKIYFNKKNAEITHPCI